MATSRARRRAAVLLAASLSAALIHAAGGSASYAVGGPAVTDPAFAFNVKLQVGDVTRACSGALLNRWWVATSASCFADGSGTPVTAGPPPLATTATIGRLDLTKSDGYVRGVDKIVPHPDRDLVLARLADAALGATTLPVGSAPPAVGDTLVAAGFGRTADTWVPNTLHTGEFKVTAVGTGTFDISAASDATLCKGDAGGPLLRRTAAGGYELAGVHYRSWGGGCLAETSTRRDAVETRVDNVASWITANTPIPAALRVSVTDTRIGVLQGDYGTRVKEGTGLSTAWTPLLANAKDIVVADDRIGVLTHDGVAWVKEGAIGSTFVMEHTGIKQLAISGNRIGVLTNDGIAKVKEGGLSANWIQEHTGIRQLALFGNRIGVLTTGGAAKVKEGGLSAAWFEQAASGVTSLVLRDDRVGLLTTDRTAKVKEGALNTGAYVTEEWNVRHLSVSGSRVGVVMADGPAKVKHGGLSANWTVVW